MGRSYEELIALTKELIAGNIDVSKYEDDCREMFGINSYVLFTLDKLIQQFCEPKWGTRWRRTGFDLRITSG